MLQAGDECAQVGIDEQRLDRAEGDVEFVERADRLDLSVVFRYPLAVKQAGGAFVAGAGYDGAGHGTCLGRDSPRRQLGSQTQFGRFEGVRLGHRILGAV